MLYLVTGSNGAGKTLFTLKWAREMQIEWKEKKGIDRPVFYDGFDINPKTEEEFNWKPCDPTKWQELPDNSIIIVDEAQRIFPTRKIGAQVPDFENEIAISHRKRGFDFFIVTQHPSNISAFIRRLVGSGWHKHLKRIFGMNAVNCLTFNYAETSCEKPTAKTNAIEQSKLRFPKEVYNWYKSAELHTAKREIPKAFYLLILLLGVAIFCIYRFASMMGNERVEDVEQLAQSYTVSSDYKGVFGENTNKGRLSTEDYLESFKPRLNGFPHTASRYDEITKPITAPYPAACISMQNKGCQCYSQQGTRIMMDEATCENIVKEGFFIDWDKEPQRRNEREIIS